MVNFQGFGPSVQWRLPGGAYVLEDGTVWFRETADYFVGRVHRLSESQVEVTARKPVHFYEGTEDDLTQQQAIMLRALRKGLIAEPTDEELAEREAEKRALSVRVASNRAKTKIRRLCKVIGADALLTLTYRANQQDLQLTKTHLREFVRRLRRVCPEFRAVAGFEVQKRGAWHVHLACPARVMTMGVGVKSYNVIRAIWRSVTGEHGGNIDVSRRFRSVRSSCARIAAYLAKYITKAFEDGEKWANRWTRFGDMELPKPVETRVDDMREFIVGAYGQLGAAGEVAGAVFSPFGDWFFFAGELPIKSRPDTKKAPAGA